MYRCGDGSDLDDLDAPVQRVGAPFTPIPFAPVLETQYLPNSNDIVDAVRKLS